MSYEKYYPNGWQSGESGGTPITPEALEHIEKGIVDAYKNLAPAVESEAYPGCYYRTVNGVVEWLNPPMISGVEYRTTKRHNGNVVYAKCVNLGTLPNTGDAQPYLAEGVRRVLSLDLIAVNSAGKSSFFAQLDIAWNLYWHTESDGLSLLITTRSDRSNRTGYAIMEFTKS